MIYYRCPLLVAPLLAGPAVAGGLAWSRTCLSCDEEVVHLATLLFPGMLLLLICSTTLLPAASTVAPIVLPVGYLPCLWIVCSLLAWPAVLLGVLAPVVWMLAYALPFVCTMQLCVLGTEIILPLSGRMGDGAPGVVILGAFLGALLGLIMALSAPLWRRVSLEQRRTWQRFFAFSFLGLFLAAMFVPRAFPPYDAAHPKRLYLQHYSQAFSVAHAPMELNGTALPMTTPVERSLVWITPFDFNCATPVGGFNFWADHSRRADTVVREDWPVVYGQFPYFFPVWKMLSLPCASVIDAPSPEVDVPLKVGLSAEQRGQVVRVHVSMSAGAPQMMLAVPSRGLSAWSLMDSLPPPRGDCDCHWILHTFGGSPRPRREWTMWVELNRTAVALEPYALEVYAHYVEGPTSMLSSMVKELPDFVTSSAWPSMWTSVKVEW